MNWEQSFILFQACRNRTRWIRLYKSSGAWGIEIVPVVTRRTIVKLDEKKEAKSWPAGRVSVKAQRNKREGEGIPSVSPPVSFKDALEFAGTLDSVIIPYETGRMEASVL